MIPGRRVGRPCGGKVRQALPEKTPSTKHETRNKLRNGKEAIPKRRPRRSDRPPFDISSFGFRYCFGFRASDFVLPSQLLGSHTHVPWIGTSAEVLNPAGGLL